MRVKFKNNKKKSSLFSRIWEKIIRATSKSGTKIGVPSNEKYFEVINYRGRNLNKKH